VCVYLGDGIGLTDVERCQQFLGLAFQLIDVRVFAQSARRLGLFHNELLSRPRIKRQPLRPVSARSGRKEFIEAARWNQLSQGDAVLPADTVAA
jgi:hypothetical protein